MRGIPRRRRRSGRRDGSAGRASQSTEGVVDEACALLTGRAGDAFVAEGRAVPGWAWLNSLAHQSPDAVLARAIECPGDVWADAAMAVARALSWAGPAATEEIQTAVLVPAELEALARTPRSPDAVVRDVRRGLIANLASQREQPPHSEHAR